MLKVYLDGTEIDSIALTSTRATTTRRVSVASFAGAVHTLTFSILNNGFAVDSEVRIDDVRFESLAGSTVLTSQQKASLSSGAQATTNAAEGLHTIGANAAQLAIVGKSIGQSIHFHDGLQQIHDLLVGLFGDTVDATVGDVLALLGAQEIVDSIVLDDDGSGDLRFRLTYAKTDEETVPLDLGVGGSGLGLSLDAEATLEGRVSLDLVLGVDAAHAFYVDLETFTLGASVDVESLDGSIALGPVAAAITGGTLALDAQVTITSKVGRLTFDELTTMAASDLFALAAAGTLAATLPVTLNATLGPVTFVGAPVVTVSSADLFAGPPTVSVASFAATLTVAGEALGGSYSIQTGSDSATLKVGVSGIGFSWGSFVTVSGATGQLLITADGAAMRLSATVGLAVPDLITGSLAGEVQMSSLATPVSETFSTGTLSLPAGPFLRVVVALVSPVTIAVGPLTATINSGSFLFQRQGTTTFAALSGLALKLSEDSSTAANTITAGEGAFVLTATGVAGYVSGTAAVGFAGVAASGKLLLRVNTTGATVDETLQVAGRSLAIRFGEQEKDLLAVSISDLSLDIAGVVSVEGSVSFTSATIAALGGAVETFAGTGLTIFFGDGPYRLANGELNPLARGVIVSNATVGLIRNSSGKFALDAIGQIAIVGSSDASLSGTGRVRVNNFGVTVSQTLAIAGTTSQVVLDFGAGETGASATFSAVSGLGLQLKLLGQTLSGDLTFVKDSAGLRIDAANAELSISDGGSGLSARGPPFLTLRNGTGSLTIGTAGVAGSIAGTVALSLPGIALTGTFSLDVNTTSAPSGLLPAGPYFRLATASGTLSLLGQTLQGSFTIQQQGPATATVTTLTATGVQLTVGAGATTFLALTNGHGSLVVSSAGIAGRLAATVTTNNVPGFALSGGVEIALDTTGTSPQLRVLATGVTLTVLGQSVTGDFAFERAVDSAGAAVVRVAAANVRATLGGGLVSLSGGQGNLILAAGGALAGSISGTVAVAIPGVSFSGSLSLELNTTGAVVNQVFTVGGVTTTLALPGGASYLRIAGSGVSLSLLGQTLTGDLAFATVGGVVHLTAANATLSLAAGIVTASGATADLTVEPTGTYGTFSATVATGLPGLGITGVLSVEVDTRVASRKLRVTGTGASITVGGLTLTADVVVEAGTDAAGAALVKVALANTAAAGPLLTLGGLVTVADGSGQLLLRSGGVAGRLTVSGITLGVAGATLTGGTLELSINTLSTPVTETFELPGGPVTLTLPAGPYVSVQAVGAQLVLGANTLSGSFTFTRSGTVTQVAIANASATVDVAGATGTLIDGQGGFVLSSAGVAGFVSGKLQAAVGGLGLGASLLLRVNTTGAVVPATTIQVAGAPVTVAFGTGEETVFSVSLSDLSLSIGDFVTIEGNVSFTSSTLSDSTVVQVFVGEGLSIFLGRGPARLPSGAPNPLASGVQLTNGRVGLVKIGSTYALFAEGTVGLVGVNGVTLTGTVTVLVNTTGRTIDTTLTIPGSTAPGIRVLFASAAEVKSFTVTGGQLALLGQTLNGDFAFSQTTGGDTAIAATNVSVSLGAASITAGSGTLLVSAAGLAGRIAGTVALAVPGVSLGTGFSVAINTTAAPVATTFTVGATTLTLALPTGPYIRIDATDISVTILGQTLQGDFAFERATRADGSTVTTIAASNVRASLGAGPYGVSLRDGSGVLLVRPTGLAGTIRGTVALALPNGVALTGAFSLAINTTTSTVTESLTVAGSPVSLQVPAGPFLRFSATGAVLDVLGQRLTGDVTIEQVTSYGADGIPGGGDDGQVLRLAAANVALTLGGATPIVSLANGTGIFVLSAAGFAGRVSGTVSVLVPGVSLTGAVALEVNATGAEVNETVLVGVTPVTLALASGSYARLTGTGVELTVLGQVLKGDLVLTRTTDATGATVRIDAANLVVKLGGTSAAPLVTVTQTPATTATFVLSAAGIAGSFAGSVALALPGATLSGAVSLKVNTTGAATLGLPAGPYLRVEATNLKLNLLGQELAADLVLEQVVNAAGQKLVRVGVANGSLSLANGLVTAGSISGAFLVTPAGVAGTATAVVQAGAGTGVGIAGTLTLTVNTTGARVDEVVSVGSQSVAIVAPAGPYVRFSGTGLVLTVLGQRISGDLSVEQLTTTSGTKVVKLALANAEIALGDGRQTLISLTGGQGSLLVVDKGSGVKGVAGRVSGTVALQNVPGVSLSGTIALELNTTGLLVDESFSVGGFTTQLKLLAGTYVRLAGTGVTLTAGGVTLAGDFTFSRDTTGPTPVVTVAFAKVEIGLGSGGTNFVRVTNASGSFTFASVAKTVAPDIGSIVRGLWGSFTAGVTVDVPGVGFTGNFDVQLNTTDALRGGIAPGFRLASSSASLTIAGQTIGGSFVIERNTAAQSVTVAVTGLTLKLGDPLAPFVNITAANNVKGAFLINAQGVAATLTGSVPAGTFNLPGGLTITATSISLELNTGTTAVLRSFTVDVGGTSTPISLDLAAGPFLRVKALGGSLTLGAGGPTVSGSFVFDESTRNGFGPGVTLDAGATGATTSVALGDVDKDGDLDLVVGVNGGSASNLYLNTLGTFGPAIGLGTAPTRAVALVDLDNDGFLDLVLGNDPTTSVRLNAKGVGSAWAGFSSTVTTVTTTALRALAAGDVDGDGFADLVVAANAGSTLVLKNQGVSGTSVWLGLTATVSLANTFATTSVVLGDVDKDGDLDLIVGANANDTRLYLNDGSTTPYATAIAIASAATTSLALGDVDGDGFLDLLVGNSGSASRLYRNKGYSTGTSPVWLGFDTTTPVDVGTGATTAVALADVDGDGKLDAILGANGATTKLFVNKGSSSTAWLGFKAGVSIGSDTPVTAALAIANLDTDTDLDLVVGVASAASKVVPVVQIKVTRVAFTGVEVQLTQSSGGSPVTIERGEGAFVLVGGTGGGIAGTVSGTIKVGAGDFAGGASLSARINSTTGAVDETILVGATAISIVFSAAEVATTTPTFKSFVQFSASGTLRIGDFVEIEGSFIGGPTSGSGTANVFIGRGPSTSPDAQGLLIRNATYAFVKNTTTSTYAAYVTGTVEVVGIAGVTATGTVKVCWNEGTAAATLTGIGTACSTTANTIAGSTASVSGSGIDLSFLGVKLSGGFSFAKGTPPAVGQPAPIVIGLTSVTLGLGEGTSPANYPLSVAISTGTITLTGAGLFGKVTGTPTVTAPGFSLSGTVDLLINTTANPVDVGAPALLPARFLQVVATGATLTVLDQVLTGTFGFEQVAGALAPSAPPGTVAPKIVRIVASGVSLTLGTSRRRRQRQRRERALRPHLGRGRGPPQRRRHVHDPRRRRQLRGHLLDRGQQHAAGRCGADDGGRRHPDPEPPVGSLPPRRGERRHARAARPEPLRRLHLRAGGRHRAGLQDRPGPRPQRGSDVRQRHHELHHPLGRLRRLRDQRGRDGGRGRRQRHRLRPGDLVQRRPQARAQQHRREPDRDDRLRPAAGHDDHDRDRRRERRRQARPDRGHERRQHAPLSERR